VVNKNLSGGLFALG
jgi:hypothetical protein